jgi:hypothetical protein
MLEWKYSSIILDLGTTWEWSASRLGRFTPEEEAPGTHWVGGWVDPRVGLDSIEKRKIYLPGIEPRQSSYID